jgi:hypothetical protein
MTDPARPPCAIYAHGLIQSVHGPRAHLLPDDVRAEISGIAREGLRRMATTEQLRAVLVHSGAMSRFLAAVQEADFSMRGAKRRDGSWLRRAATYPVEVS